MANIISSAISAYKNYDNTAKVTIVIGVIDADRKKIAKVLDCLEFNVANLGVMVKQDEYIDAAIEHGAQAILVSSIYVTVKLIVRACVNGVASAMLAI